MKKAEKLKGELTIKILAVDNGFLYESWLDSRNHSMALYDPEKRIVTSSDELPSRLRETFRCWQDCCCDEDEEL